MNPRALDDLDDLDRRIIVALQQDGRASWTAIAEAVESSVATVARRGQQLVADGVVRVAVVPALGSAGQVDSFLVRVTCRPGRQLMVAEELAALAEVRFVTMVTGGYDLMAELVVRGGASHYPPMVERLQTTNGIERWRSDLILHTYKVGHDWGRQLFADRLGTGEVHHSPTQADPDTCEPGHFDAQDWSIVTALRDDGRETFRRVAEKVEMNESSVRRRFERLRSNGCIDTLTLVAAPALGMGAETLLTVRVAPARIDAVAGELAAYPAVRYLAATLDENSLFCEVITPSSRDLSTFIFTTLSRLDGVQGWSAAMELLSLKRGFVETPWWRAQAGHVVGDPVSGVLPFE